MPEPTKTGMTKTERTEIRRIMKGRFQVLHQQVVVRENEIGMIIRKQIEEAHDADAATVETEMNTLQGKMNDLQAEARAVIRRASDKGLEPTNSHNAESSRIPTKFRPKDLHGQVRKKLDGLRSSAGFQRLDLKQMEQELDEELAIGALETTSAREFLEKIPTVDKILPLPAANGQKAIEGKKGARPRRKN